MVTTVAVVTPAAQADTTPGSAAVFTRGYDTATKVVTLTFDSDWWSTGDQATVLRILRENGITAGIALTGRYAERYPDQTRAFVAAGHQLINHSYDHPYFTQLTQAQRWSQLDRAEAAFNRLGLTSAGWFRAPYRDGYLDAGLNRDLAMRGFYLNYDWTYDTTGYKGASRETILSRVRQYTVPGATILMHLSNESTDTAYLPDIIATLRSMGYGFTTPSRAVTKGLIGAKYAAMGAQLSALGVPRTAELPGTLSGGHSAVQWFQGGRIYWRSDLGTFEVHGAIGNKYVGFGGIHSFLGHPLTDESRTPDGVGRFNHFQGGSIYWSPTTDAHEVHGAILTTWARHGWEGGVLGYPLTDETRTPDGVGRFNHFQGGSVYWAPTTGAHEVHGPILYKWAALGWERGFLGYPLSDEQSVTGGRASQFQGGNVYWSAATAAHEVHGAILTRYLAIGGTASTLGLPTSDEYATTTGRRSDFQHGAITWNSTTGEVAVVNG